MPAPTPNTRQQHVFLIVLFVATLFAHFHFATRNWHYRFMIGHEFRQTQTALIAHYIDQENNFSLDYSVPLLGKPWVLPLEFPLYEWGVVALSRAVSLSKIGKCAFQPSRAHNASRQPRISARNRSPNAMSRMPGQRDCASTNASAKLVS